MTPPLDLFHIRTGLQPAEREVLDATILGSATWSRGETMLPASDRDDNLHVIVSGWAARSRALRDGVRQITDFLLPGDVCDFLTTPTNGPDAVTALTDVTVAQLDRPAVRRAMQAHPAIEQAVLGLVLADQSVLRSWIVSFGLRDKREHLAHLLCELHHRLKRVGLVGDHEFELPLTQAELAEALGMTNVHTNRVVQGLRRDQLIEIGEGRVHILHPLKLREIAEFNSAYLES